MLTHNNTKVRLLNSLASNYSYSIGGRGYVHSTTFVAMLYSALASHEVTVSLRKKLTAPFFFGPTPEDNDYGFVVADNTVLFIKAYSEVPLPEKAQDSLPRLESRLLSLTGVVQSCLDSIKGDSARYLSRKLSVHAIAGLDLDEFQPSMNVSVSNSVNRTIVSLNLGTVTYVQHAVRVN